MTMFTAVEQHASKLWHRPQAQYWLLAAITLLAMALRFYKLGDWSFWIDEIFTLRRSQAIIGHLTTWPPVLPSLSVILTHYVTNWLGTTEFTARLVSNCIGIVSIPLLYFPVRRLFSPAVGLITVLLLAVSPWHLYWSQNARFYTSLLLLYSLTFFFFFWGYREKKTWFTVLTFPLLFLAMGERLTALLVVPVMGSYLLATQWGPFAEGRRLTWRSLVPLASLGLFVGAYDIYRYFTTGYALFVSFFQIFFGRPIDDPFRLMAFVTFHMGIPLMVLAVFGAIHLLHRRDHAGLYVTLGAAIPILLAIVISLFAFFKDRYIFASLLSWLILAAVAVHALWQMLPGRGKLFAVGVLSILVADALWNNMLYFSINNGHRRDWRGAFALVDDHRAPDDRVASSRHQLGEHYLGEDVLWMRDISPESVKATGRAFWFVADSESVWTTGAIWPWVQAHAELMDKRMLRVPEDMTLWVYRYDPRSTAKSEEP